MPRRPTVGHCPAHKPEQARVGAGGKRPHGGADRELGNRAQEGAPAYNRSTRRLRGKPPALLSVSRARSLSRRALLDSFRAESFPWGDNASSLAAFVGDLTGRSSGPYGVMVTVAAVGAAREGDAWAAEASSLTSAPDPDETIGAARRWDTVKQRRTTDDKFLRAPTTSTSVCDRYT